MVDLLETRPLYCLKITEFVKFAGIGRSTFYMYFDSVYDVLQKVEDEFFDAMQRVDSYDPITDLLIRDDDTARSLGPVMDYLGKNLRLIRILSGPNGHPAFEARMVGYIRDLGIQFSKAHNTTATDEEQVQLSEFVAGGAMASLKWWANHEGNFNSDAAFRIFLLESRSIVRLLQSGRRREGAASLQPQQAPGRAIGHDKDRV
ncbi:MAG: hypothetical protein KDB60_00360 [Propionibacteriaceae bacterium]|nr:hypothetical protein [Propionibacteriaceae bacterium]